MVAVKYSMVAVRHACLNPGSNPILQGIFIGLFCNFSVITECESRDGI